MIEDELFDLLEWEEEDIGIGWYEYWGTDYNDVNIQARLSSDTVELEAEDITEDDYIPTVVSTGGTAYVGENDYDVSVVATLSRVEWREGKMYVEYDVEEN